MQLSNKSFASCDRGKICEHHDVFKQHLLVELVDLSNLRGARQLARDIVKAREATQLHIWKHALARCHHQIVKRSPKTVTVNSQCNHARSKTKVIRIIRSDRGDWRSVSHASSEAVHHPRCTPSNVSWSMQTLPPLRRGQKQLRANQPKKKQSCHP